MHWTLLITFDKGWAQTSEEARVYAFNQLAGNRSLVDWYGSGAIADWIDIGGGVTGMLSRAKEAVPQEPPRSPFPSGLRAGEIPKDVFDRLGQELGNEDDAMVVDAQLYKAVLRPFVGLNRAYGGDLPIFLDLDGDPVSQDIYVDLKWLVVVDCHA